MRMLALLRKELADERQNLALVYDKEHIASQTLEMRPGPLRRLGLDYDSVRTAVPRLVYCQAQGFRTSSAEADLPAYDDIIQALTGFPQLNEMGFGAAHFVPSTIWMCASPAATGSTASSTFASIATLSGMLSTPVSPCLARAV